MNIHFYEINAQYIDYLSALEPHFFHNKRPGQHNKRKYIGIILQVNNMFPVPEGLYTYIHIQKVKDASYRALLQAEYRIIKKIRNRIIKNANMVYKHRIEKGTSTPLGKRCRDFLNLEKACRNYLK